MTTTTRSSCPAWCDRGHDDDVHRGLVGEQIGEPGRELLVWLEQLPGAAPGVVLELWDAGRDDAPRFELTPAQALQLEAAAAEAAGLADARLAWQPAFPEAKAAVQLRA
jgi:hypothetical protein